MRTETKIGVVAGFAVVVAASVYFWKTKSRDRDLIVALTPSVVQPMQLGGARPAPAPTRPEIPPPNPMPVRTAVAANPLPQGTGATQLAKPEPSKPATLDAPGTPTPERLAMSPGFVPENPTPPAYVPLRTGPSETLRLAAGVSTPMPVNPAPEKLEPIKPANAQSVSNSAYPKSEVRSKASEPSPITDSTSSGTVKLPPAIAQPPAPAVRPMVGSEWKSTASTATPGEWPKYHTVAKGETLAAIARKTYGDSRKVGLILAANPEIKNPHSVRVGTKLTLPSAPEPAKAADVAIAPAADGAKPISLMARPNTGSTEEKKDAAAANPIPGGKTYTVQQGDSLYSIAVETLGDGRKWPELMRANKAVVGADGSKIRPGMVLTIPDVPASKPGATEQSAKR